MDISGFIIASLVLIITPGPDVYFVITQSLSGGKASGIYTALGLSLGNLFHTLLVCLGVSALINSYPLAFDTIKYMRFIYLLYLSFDAYYNRTKKVLTDSKEVKKDSKKLFMKGLIMNILNPKVSLFFIALLPQFVSNNSKNTSLELFTLGLIFIAIVVVCFSTFALIANFLSSFLNGIKNIDIKINLVKSLVFLILAIGVLSV